MSDNIDVLNIYLRKHPVLISSSPVYKGKTVQEWFNINITSNWSSVFPNKLLQIKINQSKKNKEFIFTTKTFNGYNAKNSVVSFKDSSNLFQLYKNIGQSSEKKIYIYDKFVMECLRHL